MEDPPGWMTTLSSFKRLEPRDNSSIEPTQGKKMANTTEETSYSQDIHSLQNAVGSLTTTVDTILAEIRGMRSELSGRVSALESTVGDMEGKIASIEHQNSASISEVRFDVRMAAIEKRELSVDLKIDDIENRERRNNLRILGLPESDNEDPATVPALVQDFINEIFKDSNGLVVVMDRAHRGANRNRSPRPVIVRFHYYADRDRILSKLRGKESIEFRGSQIRVFPDLSLLTLDRRRECKPLTTWLRSQSIKYRWGFPFSINFEYNREEYHLSHLEDIRSTTSSLTGGGEERPSSSQGQDSEASAWHTPKRQRKEVKNRSV